jgi:threonine/homoserine/homoserine lactone efflux protein
MLGRIKRQLLEWACGVLYLLYVALSVLDRDDDAADEQGDPEL